MSKRKLLTIILLVLVIAGTVSAIYFFNQATSTSQTTQTRADTGVAWQENGQGKVAVDPCGFIQITASESPACKRLANALDASGNPISPVTGTNEVAEYSTTFTLKNLSNQTRTVAYKKMGFFCDEPYGQPTSDNQGGYRPHFISNPEISDETITLAPGEEKNITVVKRNQSAAKCGTFQNDIVYGSFQTDLNIVSVDGNTSCALPSTEAQARGSVAAWGLCQTGKPFAACPAASPTTAPTAAPQQQPPTITLNAPKSACVQQTNQISVRGTPGSYSGVRYQVWAKKKDGTPLNAAECPSGTFNGPRCLLGTNTAPSFNVTTAALAAGDFQIYAQAVGQNDTILCTNDPDTSSAVARCGRACAGEER